MYGVTEEQRHAFLTRTLILRCNVKQGQYITSNVSCLNRINPLMPELNSSAQRRLPRFFTGDFYF
jgi:hypothetical protein